MVDTMIAEGAGYITGDAGALHSLHIYFTLPVLFIRV